jgi:polar amino acid transport system substrate-binding protein
MGTWVLFFANSLAFGNPSHPRAWRLVTGEDYPPFSYRDEKGQMTGFAVELLRESLAAVQHTTHIEFLPWARGEMEVKGLKADATFPYIKTEERRKSYAFSEPLELIRTHAYMLKERPLPGNDLRQWKGKSICLPVGYATEEPIMKAFAAGDLKRVSASDPRSCLLMLQQKRIDAFLENQYNGWFLVQKYVPAQKEIFSSLDVGYSPQSLHLMVSQTHPEKTKLLDALHKGMKILEKNGKLQQLKTTFQIR